MKLIAIIISWLTIVGCQAKSDGFIIKGELEGAPENEWIFLTDAKQRVYYDSVQIKKGRFEFRGKLDSPELRNIVFYGVFVFRKAPGRALRAAFRVLACVFPFIWIIRKFISPFLLLKCLRSWTRKRLHLCVLKVLSRMIYLQLTFNR